MEQLKKLQRMNEEVDQKLARLPRVKKKEVSPAMRAAQMLNEIDCLVGEEKVMLKEIDDLKQKIGVNTDSSHVISLEAAVKAKRKRNEEIEKMVKGKNTQIKILEKKCIKKLGERDTAPSLQREV